jgi:hypothetical protein
MICITKNRRTLNSRYERRSILITDKEKEGRVFLSVLGINEFCILLMRVKYSLGSCRSTTELRPRDARYSHVFRRITRGLGGC